MKNIAVLLLVMAMAAGASAQGPIPFSVYVGGLISVPSSPDGFKESYKNGFHGMLGLGFKTMPAMQFIAKAEYHKFGYDFGSTTNIQDGAESVWLYGADLKLGLNIPAAPIKPYILGGGGLAKVSFAQFTGTDVLATAVMNASVPDDQSKFFYEFGGGLDFKFAPSVNFFVQGRYVSVATDGQSSSFIPITLGLRFF